MKWMKYPENKPGMELNGKNLIAKLVHEGKEFRGLLTARDGVLYLASEFSARQVDADDLTILSAVAFDGTECYWLDESAVGSSAGIEERDKALRDCENACRYCKYHKYDAVCVLADTCDDCVFEGKCPCADCMERSKWEWGGLN